MKASNVFARGLSFFLFLTISGSFLLSCDPSDGLQPELTPEEKYDNEAALQSEIDENFFYEDIDDLTASAVESDLGSSGKAQSDDRLNGAVVTRSGSAESGTLTIDFGAGCTDARGLIRKGSIVVRYTGRQDKANSSREVTFVNLRVGDATVEGTRRIKVVSISDDVTIEEIDVEDGRITWADGSVARRKLHRIRERHHGNILDRLIIYGTEQGNHRNGRGFYIEIPERLVFDRECMKNGGLIAVEGKKLIKHGQREITVDYGDGKCDNIVSITNKNGKTWEYVVGS
jgi:hypothetical protein